MPKPARIVIDVICANCKVDLAEILVEDRTTSDAITFPRRCPSCGDAVTEIFLFPIIQAELED